MPNFKSILVTEAQINVSDDARDFNNIETRAVIKFLFFLQDKAPKETHTILIETLGEHGPSYAIVKNWVA